MTSKRWQTFSGSLPDDDDAFHGAFYVNPTVYSNVDYSATLAQEEMLGPVLKCVVVAN